MAKDYNPSQRNREAFEALTDTAGNVPPQAVELEEAVLGALMLEKDSIIAVQEYVTPDAFYTEEHRTIYRAIEELSMELKPIDLYTVTERLKAKKELKKVGGASYLAQLTQKVGSAANVEFHAKIIAQKYVQRELIRSATEIQKRSYDESTDVTELIGYAEGEIFKVAEGHVKRSVQASKDILARALMQIEEASKNTSAFNGVPSGFMAIDRVTLGWQLSDLIIIAARPSMGKTAFVLSMARNMAVDHEQGVAFFSLEMSAVQLMMRLIIAETGLSGNDVKSGRLTPEQWRHLESATKPLGSAPLYIDDTPALSVFEFRSKARRLKIHHDIKIIIIDYLQLMTGNQDSKGNREQEVAFISRTLKAIAKELNVPMIALSPKCAAARSVPSSRTSASRAPSSRTPTSWPSSTVRSITASIRTRTACRRRVWPRSSLPSTVTAPCATSTCAFLRNRRVSPTWTTRCCRRRRRLTASRPTTTMPAVRTPCREPESAADWARESAAGSSTPIRPR